MQKIDELKYGKFTTSVKITDEVREFFENNDEKIDLTEDLNSDLWYQEWLLKYLDDDKDGTPDEKYGKDFELIYCGIIENPEDFSEVEEILENLKINPEKMIFDGTQEILKSYKNNRKFWARFILIKK